LKNAPFPVETDFGGDDFFHPLVSMNVVGEMDDPVNPMRRPGA